MAIHDEALEQYLEALATPHDELIRRATKEGRERKFPIVGPQVGRLFEQVARMLGARRIFELGSGFGYSTLWFARALPPDGVIHHTDGSEENSRRARALLSEAGLVDKVRFHVGDAMETLRTLDDPEPFDILFCDVDKHGYPEAWEIMRERVRVGGAILFDNLLWDGWVADPSKDDADTAAIRRVNETMWADPDFLGSMLPIRDGVGLLLRLR